MKRRDFLKSVGIGVMPIAPIVAQPTSQQESLFYRYITSDEAQEVDIRLTSPTGRRKSTKEVVLEYITRLFNDNWDEETQAFQFIGTHHDFVVMYLDLFADGGRANLYCTVYENPEDIEYHCTLPGFSIRNGNYNTPLRKGLERNKNVNIKSFFTSRTIARELGHHQPYYIMEATGNPMP